MHKLSAAQQARLLSNPNVQEITDSFVVYTPSFKLKAVESYLGGTKPEKIFKDAGIPPEYFKENYCRYCLKRWVAKYKEEGPESLKEDRRGQGSQGRPKSTNLDDLTYEELKALVEIQREVIEEIKKRKALAKKKS